MRTVTLGNGVEIPQIGYGTWQTPSGAVAERAVLDALETGYRHIDTAAAYKNEGSVGAAIRKSGIKREEIFLTSKVWNSERGYDRTMKAFEATMDQLQTDYLDLYLIHWPNPVAFRDRGFEMTLETWRAMEELYKKGRIRAIGVSNFWTRHLLPLIAEAEIKPMVDQIRVCPGEPQTETVACCRENGIAVEGYSPFGTGRLFENESIKEIARKYGKSVAQVTLNWGLRQGVIPLPKSLNKARMAENLDVFGFELSQEDFDSITGLPYGTCGKATNPDIGNF